ncbi:sensor histidine kinase [Methylococcus sp. EFPC2]|uniref:sensor histidine kinase n=1 Tax=Methylococcus sp. EFPC2 TaxID=2812648 RepID=UPI0019687AF4|nr:ATP-binding protein [Methylococcus sp. EFPC2]QSA95830.1 two-component sensor histidine kinase [Methylococcus sp. EFPC2]
MRLGAAPHQTLLDRPARLRGMALLALLLSVLFILGWMIWRNLERLDTIHAYVGYSHRIQNAGLDLQQALMDQIASGRPLKAERLREIAKKIRDLAGEEAHLSPDTPEHLRQVNDALSRAGGLAPLPEETELFQALRAMNQILNSETDQRETVLEGINRNTLGELELATATLAGILLLAWVFLRRRILAPLHDLRRLLLNLADEDYSPIETEGLDPLLLPVFNSYNVMVKNLGELEETKRRYAESLEAEVRSATRALLEQQRSLARAEKLAAVGELAASLAHELRNPLAGIQMSCANLRSEIGDPDQAERLDLIGEELKRMTRLLNELLAQGRQVPTPPSEFQLAPLVRELLALTRYQLPPQIALDYDIPDDLACFLPESNLRQALLNLVLNAAQALDGASGHIRLSARIEDGTLSIEVYDDGPGFGDQILTLGIRPFGTGRASGTGLGLAMVQRFARELGGQLRLANHLPHGACVSLTLPAGKPS